MRIVLDATGGDRAPGINLEGAVEALRAWPDVEIILLGPVESLAGEWKAASVGKLTPEQEARVSV